MRQRDRGIHKAGKTHRWWRTLQAFRPRSAPQGCWCCQIRQSRRRNRSGGSILPIRPVSEKKVRRAECAQRAPTTPARSCSGRGKHHQEPGPTRLPTRPIERRRFPRDRPFSQVAYRPRLDFFRPRKRLPARSLLLLRSVLGSPVRERMRYPVPRCPRLSPALASRHPRVRRPPKPVRPLALRYGAATPARAKRQRCPGAAIPGAQARQAAKSHSQASGNTLPQMRRRLVPEPLPRFRSAPPPRPAPRSFGRRRISRICPALP